MKSDLNTFEINQLNSIKLFQRVERDQILSYGDTN